MELQDRNLSTNMTGDDVSSLHVELQKLGFRIPTAERQLRRFGRFTGEAVRTFQKTHNLSVTGTVDESTVTLINREVEALETRPFVVRGSVNNKDNEPLNVVVRAFDEDLRTAQILGEARTDAKGQYRIEYNDDLAGPWTNSSLGTFSPDPGATTTRLVTFPAGTGRFFRAVAIRPLAP